MAHTLKLPQLSCQTLTRALMKIYTALIHNQTTTFVVDTNVILALVIKWPRPTYDSRILSESRKKLLIQSAPGYTVQLNSKDLEENVIL